MIRPCQSKKYGSMWATTFKSTFSSLGIMLGISIIYLVHYLHDDRYTLSLLLIAFSVLTPSLWWFVREVTLIVYYRMKENANDYLDEGTILIKRGSYRRKVFLNTLVSMGKHEPRFWISLRLISFAVLIAGLLNFPLSDTIIGARKSMGLDRVIISSIIVLPEGNETIVTTLEENEEPAPPSTHIHTHSSYYSTPTVSVTESIAETRPYEETPVTTETEESTTKPSDSSSPSEPTTSQEEPSTTAEKPTEPTEPTEEAEESSPQPPATAEG